MSSCVGPGGVEKGYAKAGNFVLKDLIAYGHSVRRVTAPKGPVSLHCMATSAGYEQRRNEVYSWDGLQRGAEPFLVIQHTLAGTGNLDFSGVRYRLTPGQTMILSFPHANRYWLERGDHWEYFWLVLNGREALRLAHAVIDTAGPVLTMSEPLVDRLALACLAILVSETLTSGAASSAAFAAVATLYDGAFADRATPAGILPPALARVTAHIDGHLAAPLDMDRLARIAQMSRGHFVRQFSAAVGVAPSHYLFHARMERVTRLLLATDMTVDAIATACGFSNGNYLAKAFRRAFGVSPVEYRLNNRNPAMAG